MATKKRAYQLSEAGLRRLRESVAASRPWVRSTGPRTLQGKARSSRNAWKHGFRTGDAIIAASEAREMLRGLTADSDPSTALRESEWTCRARGELILLRLALGPRYRDLPEPVPRASEGSLS